MKSRVEWMQENEKVKSKKVSDVATFEKILQKHE